MSTTFSCSSNHEIFATVLTIALTVSLIVSNGSQHYKIISSRLSLGFSPWFLLLGATSSTATMLDIWMLQWGVIKCCGQVGFGACLSSLGGIFQVTLQWVLFTITFALFLIFYPSSMKHTRVNNAESEEIRAAPVKSLDWRHSVLCAWLTFAHFTISFVYTIYLIMASRSSPDTYPTPQIVSWATFLGASSAALAIGQYVPQLWRTWHFGYVGALSIPMYCFQVPGAAIMVLSIALRKGTDWTSWAMYAASGFMGGLLLALCFVWKIRHMRLGLDDFGRPVGGKDGNVITIGAAASVAEERTPLLNPPTGE